MRPPLGQALQRSLRLRCPNCGHGALFARWFRMLRGCPRCRLSYFRESGYYVGAMIINYGVTAVLVTAAYLLSLLLADFVQFSINTKIALWMAFAVLLSLALMRHSYSLWLAVDFWVEPWEPPTPDEASCAGSSLAERPPR